MRKNANKIHENTAFLFQQVAYGATGTSDRKARGEARNLPYRARIYAKIVTEIYGQQRNIRNKIRKDIRKIEKYTQKSTQIEKCIRESLIRIKVLLGSSRSDREERSEREERGSQPPILRTNIHQNTSRKKRKNGEIQYTKNTRICTEMLTKIQTTRNFLILAGSMRSDRDARFNRGEYSL